MMVALAFFQWHLVHILTPFLMPFLWLMAAGFFLVMAMEKPRTGDFGGNFIEIEQFDEHWYFVRSE
jgi:hypothetical protein